MLSRRAFARAPGCRSIAFTVSDKTLATSAAEAGYKSDLWVSIEDDMWWVNRLTGRKAEDGAVKIWAPKRMELLNVSQLATELAEVDESGLSGPASLATGKEYSGQLKEDLKTHADIQGFRSKYWLTRQLAKKMSYKLKGNARPSVVFVKRPCNLINIDTLEDPEAVRAHPILGDNGAPIFGDLNVALREWASAQGFTRSLFFSPEGIDSLNLVPKDGAPPLVRTSERTSTWVNIAQFEDPETLKKMSERKLQRYVCDHAHPFHLYGYSLTQKHVVESLSQKTEFEESLWMKKDEADFRVGVGAQHFKVKHDVQGVVLPTYVSTYYNVEQLVDVDSALSVVGMSRHA